MVASKNLKAENLFKVKSTRYYLFCNIIKVFSAKDKPQRKKGRCLVYLFWLF